MKKNLPKKKTKVEISKDIKPVQEYYPAKTLIEFRVTVDINVKLDIIKTEEHEEK